MTTRTTIRRWAAATAVAACTAGLLAAQALPAEAYRKPVANGLANPGVIQVGGTWVIHSTGGYNGHNVATSTRPGGGYDVKSRKLLTATPSWMVTKKGDRGVWAPSVVQATTGKYVVFYAARVKGSATGRCIGTGTADNALGPFAPTERALACWKGSGARPYDQIKSEGKGFSLIDPTPAQIGSELVLTYKTGKKKGVWHTTTRMLKLNPADPTTILANPRHADGGSIKLTDSRNKYIEENPVLVQHGARLTLFTSFGWYGTCRYSTRYRQNTSLWTGWLKKKPSALRFAKKPNTCGTGNGQVVRDATTGGWLYFFNGHTTKATPGGPKGLYVGNLDWKGGKPRITSLR